MDIAPPPVPQAGQPAGRPDLTAFNRDHINDLLSQLARLDTLVGQPVPKTRMNGGVVGLEIPRERLVDVVRTLRDQLGFNLLACVTSVDMIDHVESLYHLRCLDRNWLIQIRVKLPLDDPSVDSLVGLYPAANWLEREQYDLMGITYMGHPDLRASCSTTSSRATPCARASARRRSPCMTARRRRWMRCARSPASSSAARSAWPPRVWARATRSGCIPASRPLAARRSIWRRDRGCSPAIEEGDITTEHGYDVDTENTGPVIKQGAGE